MFSNADASTWTHAKKGTIYNKIYEQIMTEESFSKLTSYEAMHDFLKEGANVAFYTSLDLIPDDIFCKV